MVVWLKVNIEVLFVLLNLLYLYIQLLDLLGNQLIAAILGAALRVQRFYPTGSPFSLCFAVGIAIFSCVDVVLLFQLINFPPVLLKSSLHLFGAGNLSDLAYCDVSVIWSLPKAGRLILGLETSFDSCL